MGMIIAKLRYPTTTMERLDHLQDRIKSLEERRRTLHRTHKNVLEQFLTSSIAIYLMTVFLFYYCFCPETNKYRVISFIPIALAPFLIFAIKRVITWFYRFNLRMNNDHLEILEEQKMDVLERCLKTETSSVARNLFEKYAPRAMRFYGFPSQKSIVQLTPEDNVSEIDTVSIHELVDASVEAVAKPSTEFQRDCIGHNVLVLEEDLEQLEFRCRYCNAVNSSRKSRLPTADLQFDFRISDQCIDQEQDNQYKLTEVLYSKEKDNAINPPRKSRLPTADMHFDFRISDQCIHQEQDNQDKLTEVLYSKEKDIALKSPRKSHLPTADLHYDMRISDQCMDHEQDNQYKLTEVLYSKEKDYKDISDSETKLLEEEV